MALQQQQQQQSASSKKRETAPLIAAQRKNQMPSAKRAADQDAAQSVERSAQKKQKGRSADVVAASTLAKEAGAAKKADGEATKKSVKAVGKKKVEAEKKKKKGAVEKQIKKKATSRKPRISFTQQSRQPGKRADGDTRPRRAVALIDDEAEDEDDDEDFDGEDEDDDEDEAEEEEEDDVVYEEGGVAELGGDVDEDEADDNATVAISDSRDGADDDDDEEEKDAKLMSSTRPRSRTNAVRGGPDAAAARRIAAIEFDSESDAEAIAAAAAPLSGKRKKAAADGESVATVEKNAAKSRRRAAVETEAVADSDTEFDMVAVLRKNAKKFKLVPEQDGAELSTTNVRKHVERKLRGGGESTKLVYRLLHLNATRRCAYTKAELMKPNTEKPLRIDMFNFLHFAAVVNGKYKMEDVMSFLVDKNGMMCACPRRALLALLYLDHGRNYAQFRVFYDNLPSYIDLNNDDKVPPVPPALYTSGEIRKAKPLCPTIEKMSKWTQSCGGGGGDDDDDDAAAATDMQSVVPATEFDGDDARSVATSKHPKTAAAPSRRSRAAARPPATPASASASFGVYTNVDLANPAYRGLNLVSRSYGAGTQLPLATFLGNPMARLVLEFGPMCPTEQHAVYFAHVIRAQLSANGPVIDEMIRDVSGPPAAAAAAAAAHEQDE